MVSEQLGAYVSMTSPLTDCSTTALLHITIKNKHTDSSFWCGGAQQLELRAGPETAATLLTEPSKNCLNRVFTQTQSLTHLKCSYSTDPVYQVSPGSGQHL